MGNKNKRSFQNDDSTNTTHHVPPRHPDPQPHFLCRVDERHHQAYHLLFSAAKSYEDACRILQRDWWTPLAKH